jgi:hypothetical protein
MLTSDSPKTSAQFRFLSLAFIGIVAGLSFLTSFLFGPPLGHSLPNNLVWLTSFDAAIWRGEIYPRWLPELWFGSGSPDFFFYGPLPFWISSILGHTVCWTCDVNGVLTTGGLIILAMSGLTYFIFARRFFSKEWALVAAGLYMVLPYHLSMDWGLRQALGEFAAIAVMPLIAYFLMGLFKAERFAGIGFALSLLALILCHLPSVVICALLFLPMALYYGFAKTSNSSESVWFLSKCACYGLIGLGLSALYWLPAFTLLPEVASQTLWVNYYDWSHWMLFDGQPKFNEAMIMLLQIWLVIATVLTVGFIYKFREKNEKAVWAIAPLVVGWIFMTPISWLLWKSLPFLQAIQFPWRFMMVAEFGLPLVVAALIPKTRNALIAVCVGLIVLAGVNGYFGHRLAQLIGTPSTIVDGMMADHLSAWEYLPKTAYAPIEKITKGRRDALRADWSANPSEFAAVVASPVDTKTSLQSLSSRHLIVDVDAAAPTHLIVHQFYWHLWQAHDVATGQEIKLSAEPKFGLIAFDVAAGKSKVALNLAYSWTEKIGFAISALSAALLVSIVLLLHRKSRKQRQAS